MKIAFINSKPKQYLYNNLTLSGINIVHNRELDALKDCFLKKNSPESVEEFFTKLHETPVNKKNPWGLINLEVISHFNSNKKNLAPERIRCAIWRRNEDSGPFFDIELKKFGKNKKREHYTEMNKVSEKIVDECKKLADGTYDSGLREAKKLVIDILKWPERMAQKKR